MPHIGPYYMKKPGFKRTGVWGFDRLRLWSKVDLTPDENGCHNWRGAMSPSGALMGAWKFANDTDTEHVKQQMTQVRRLIWADVNNEDPSPYQIKLSCGNQKCCNYKEHFVVHTNNRKSMP